MSQHNKKSMNRAQGRPVAATHSEDVAIGLTKTQTPGAQE